MYLCGKVLQPETYNRLAGEAHAEAGYFPAYRRGEFAPVELVRGRRVSELEK